MTLDLWPGKGLANLWRQQDCFNVYIEITR